MTFSVDANNVGKAMPCAELGASAKKRSCDVVLLEEDSDEHIECKASGKTHSHCETGN